VTGDREERNRVLGFPVDRHPNTRPAGKPPTPPPTAQPEDRAQAAQPRERRQAGEPQRILGFPADWLDEFAAGVLRPLLRRIRGPRDRG
jgi:hypothetical protein